MDPGIKDFLLTTDWLTFFKIFESLIADCRSLGQILAISRLYYVPLYNQRRGNLPSFFEGYAWDIILKRLSDSFLDHTIDKTPIAVSLKRSHNTNSHWNGLFQTIVTYQHFDCWNKYRISHYQNHCTFFDNSDLEMHDGHRAYIDPMMVSYTTLYYAKICHLRLYIYTDTPWIDDSCVFRIDLEYAVGNFTIVETVIGLLLVVKKLYSDEVHTYKILFGSTSEGSKLQLLTTTEVPWHRSTSGITCMHSSTMIGVDVIESTNLFYLYDSIDRHPIFKCRSYSFFDSFGYSHQEIFDILTGEIFFVADDDYPVIGMTRKDDGTGYLVWINRFEYIDEDPGDE